MDPVTTQQVIALCCILILLGLFPALYLFATYLAQSSARAEREMGEVRAACAVLLNHAGEDEACECPDCARAQHTLMRLADLG